MAMGWGGGGKGWGDQKKTNGVNLIGNFTLIAVVLENCKKYFPRYCAKRNTKMTIFRRQNGLK